MSKDPALLQRDWNVAVGAFCCGAGGRKTLPCSKGIETYRSTFQKLPRCRKTLPCSKGIETHKSVLVIRVDQSKDPALFQRDWDNSLFCHFCISCRSKDPTLFQRDWNVATENFLNALIWSKGPPWAKGIGAFKVKSGENPQEYVTPKNR